MNQTDVRVRAKKLIEDAVNAVLITNDDSGFPHPRTMWTAGIDDDFTTYFVTGRQLLKVRQIEANPRVCVFWTRTDNGQIGWDYTLLKGEATISDAQTLRDRFWNEAVAQYFPEGSSDPSYVVIVIKPKELMLMDSHNYPLDTIEF